jgi:hypothetical protein
LPAAASLAISSTCVPAWLQRFALGVWRGQQLAVAGGPLTLSGGPLHPRVRCLQRQADGSHCPAAVLH